MTNSEIQNITLLEVIAPSPDIEKPTFDIPQAERDEVYKRWKGFGEHEVTHKIGRKEETKVEYLQPDWGYIFRAISNENMRKKLTELFEYLENPEVK